MSIRVIYLTVCALLLLAPCGDVFAQDEISVQASLQRESVFVGDELRYVVEVFGASDPQLSMIDIPDGLEMISHGRSLQSSTGVVYEDGQRKQIRQRKHSFSFTITPIQDGSFSIPAPVVVDRGSRHVGNETNFKSVLPSESLDDELVISIDRTRLFANETIELECTWWLGDNTSQFNFGSSTIPDSFEVRPISSPGNAQYKIEFPLSGQRLTGYVSNGIHNGREKSNFTFRISITPTETGNFTIGPFRTLFTRQPSVGDRYRAYTESNSIDLEVITVPEIGRPNDYEGAIGEYALEARASNNSVRVGDPIELTLIIRGDEPMTGVRGAPDLGSQAGFENRFKVDSGGWRELAPQRERTRIYQTTIRALSDTVREIPPIRLTSFDPDIGQFRIFTTDAIPLRVEDVNEVTLADAIVSGDDLRYGQDQRRPVMERIELTPAAPGLWAHAPIEEMTRHEGFDLAETIQRPVWITTIAAPPSIYFCTLGVLAYRRNRNAEAVRLNQAYRSARRLDRTEALKAYTARVLDVEPHAFAAADVESLLLDTELKDELQRVLMLSELPSGAAGDMSDSDLLKRVHTRLLIAARKGHES
jgi:hypothetical protein